MANISRPAGLVPLEYIDGSPWTGKGRMFVILSTDPNAYAPGDPVTLSGSGDANGVAGVTLATVGDGNKVLGAILGFGGKVYGGPGAIPGQLESTIIPATKTQAYYVLVSDDPAIVYSIQEDSSGTALTQLDIGVNINLKAGTNNGYSSTWQFDNSSGGTGATKQLTLMGLVQTSDNAFGTAAKWKVRINNHNYSAGQIGV